MFSSSAGNNSSTNILSDLTTLKQTYTDPLDLTSQINLLSTCKSNYYFFRNVVPVSELLKLISTYEFKVDENDDNKNIHKAVMKKVSKILDNNPELALRKGTHSVYLKGHLGAQIQGTMFDDDDYAEQEEVKQEVARLSFQIPKTYHESPFQCAYRTGNKYLYNLIFDYAKKLPDGIACVKKQIEELESYSYGYNLLLWPTLTAEMAVKDLLPPFTHIFLLAENETLPKDIPLNTLLLSYSIKDNELVLNWHEIDDDEFAKMVETFYLPVADINMTVFDSLPKNRLNVITPDTAELFNTILECIDEDTSLLNNQVTLIKKLDEENNSEFYLWARANSKWTLTKLPSADFLRSLQFPESHKEPALLTEVPPKIYDEFKHFHTELFDGISAVSTGNRFISETKTLNRDDRYSETLWLEVGRDQKHFPAWFWNFWDLELFADPHKLHTIDIQNLWTTVSNYDYKLGLLERMQINKDFTENLGIYWTFQYLVRTPCSFFDRGFRNQRYQRDNTILAVLASLIISERSSFREYLATCENELSQKVSLAPGK